MPHQRRQRRILWRALALGGLLALPLAAAADAQAPAPMADRDPLTGPRSRLARDWVGARALPADVPILVMAGHADSQGVGGSGTGGAAVDRYGAAPMQPGIRDELYWNLQVAQRVVSLGLQRGLRISFYDPPLRAIANGDDPRTNWSRGKAHAAAGGYALEIHFDAYGPDGVGSGVMPALHRPFSRLDEALAQEFGGYPMWFRGGLGAPRRGITILEIGKLEAPLEPALRNPSSREQALATIAERVVRALERGLSPQPDGVGSAPATPGPQASSGGG